MQWVLVVSAYRKADKCKHMPVMLPKVLECKHCVCRQTIRTKLTGESSVHDNTTIFSRFAFSLAFQENLGIWIMATSGHSGQYTTLSFCKCAKQFWVIIHCNRQSRNNLYHSSGRKPCFCLSHAYPINAPGTVHVLSWEGSVCWDRQHSMHLRNLSTQSPERQTSRMYRLPNPAQGVMSFHVMLLQYVS